VEGTVSYVHCFAPDHEDEDLNARSLNRGDRAALTACGVPGIAGLCFAPDHEDEQLSLERLNRADQAILALV
jgi:hypothetical protein